MNYILPEFIVVIGIREPTSDPDNCNIHTHHPCPYVYYFPQELMPSPEPQNIPVIFQIAGALALLTHPSHLLVQAPGDSLRRAFLQFELFLI
ncbi:MULTISPECIES: hypothetical protein [Dickeya]|uniref:hypothetical protein n=1 Tax=Dickeya TaxID=204037 RepID=UPI00187BD4AA|nr:MULTISPECIES: hypothetical protein [Dickeya]UGA53323.1 hypothetical protein QR68_12945 [Dickeya fangzhongdai]UWH09672.1 hypothetical protein K0H75_12945 [Dickeya fangzhongdai]